MRDLVVAAINHPADNLDDDSGYGTPRQLVDRVRDISSLSDFVVRSWSKSGTVNPERIGAFGFSAGGYAVLTAAGAQPVYSRLPSHCQVNKENPLCAVLLPRWKAMAGVEPPRMDSRIRAVVAAAPALGFIFNESSVRALRASLQLWAARNDEILMHRFHAGALAQRLPE